MTGSFVSFFSVKNDLICQPEANDFHFVDSKKIIHSSAFSIIP